MLTLVVVTRNGAPTLPWLFDALVRADAPDGGWKLVLADNGSTDNTKAVVDRYRGALQIEYVFEPKGGQNFARNAALERIEGDLVVFTDDDTTPDRRWLVAYRHAADADRDFSCFGGPILPRWEREPPPWILEKVDLGCCFALSNPEQPDGPCLAADIWGPNMAVRRAVFDDGLRFNDSVGSSGASYAMGGETEFLTRLSKAGFKSRFCRDAQVQHFIRAHQLDRDWILGRAVRFGRGRYYLEWRDAPYSGPYLFGMPRYLIRRTIEQYLRVSRSRLLDRDRVFAEQWEFNYLVGKLQEARRRSVGAAAAQS